MFNKTKRFGFLPEVRNPSSWQFRGLSGITNEEVLRADGQWDAFLPVYETQRNQNFDTMACVTFSALNCIETLLYRKYGIQRNFSDRFNAKMNGTTADGNNFYNVAEGLKKDGLVDESEWPFPSWLQTSEDYYSTIPDKVKSDALTFYDQFTITYEYVWDTPDSLVDALQYGPVQVAFHAYCPLDGDVYTHCTLGANHAVELYGYELGQYWKIYDHYDNKFKKLAWDTIFYGALKYNIEKVTPQPMPQFKPNTLYQVVEGPGEFLLYIAGLMRRDDLPKLIASWEVVNGGNTNGQVGALTLKDIDGVQMYDLKGNKV